MITILNRTRRAFFAMTGAAAFRGTCLLRAEEPKVETPTYNRMTDEEEIALGREFCRQWEKEREIRFVELESVQDYASQVIRQLVRSSHRSNLPYSIKVINTKEINASAVLGGFVYLNRGLLEWARSEAELVAVLAHEVGHIDGRHGANRVARVTAADSLLGEASRLLFGSTSPADVIRNLGGPIALLVTLRS